MRQLLIAISVLLASSAPAQADATLVSDISSHRIGITSSYTGTELLLFGALGEGGGDVVIVVRGPDQDLTVRRKGRVGGVWLNTDAVSFRGVPGFYAIAANRPLSAIAGERILRRVLKAHDDQPAACWLRLARRYAFLWKFARGRHAQAAAKHDDQVCLQHRYPRAIMLCLHARHMLECITEIDEVVPKRTAALLARSPSGVLKQPCRRAHLEGSLIARTTLCALLDKQVAVKLDQGVLRQPCLAMQGVVICRRHESKLAGLVQSSESTVGWSWFDAS